MARERFQPGDAQLPSPYAHARAARLAGAALLLAMCLLGIFLAVFASTYNPVRSAFLCVNWVLAEVE
eukprot:2233331-Alexandrium_andersonii.AAC.1